MCYMLFNTNQMCSTTPALLLLEHQVSCDFPFQYFGLDFPGTSWKVSLFGDILVRIQSECGKMRTRITPTTDTFYAVSVFGYENSFIIQRRVSAFFCHLIKYAGFSIVSFSWSFSIGSQYMYTLRLTIRL